MLKKVNGVSSRGSANREHIVGDVMNETCMLIPLSCLRIPKAHSPSSVETPPTVSAIPLLPSPFFFPNHPTESHSSQRTLKIPLCSSPDVL